MVAALNSFTGLSAADISTLFGTASATSPATQTSAAKTAATGTAGTQITGAGGGATNAAKAIQAIVTQIQIEKMQTSTQGKTATLDSASVAVTYGATAEVDSNPQTINSGTTVLSSVATATGNDLAGAVGTLMTQVKDQEAQVEAAQGGLLMTKDEVEYDGHASNSSVNWTANSVTVDINAAENQGLQLYQEEGSLNGIMNITGEAQQFQAPSATSTPAASAPTSASSDNAGSSSSSSGANGSALYLVVSRYHGSFGAIDDKEQQLVSDFLNGALPGQNGTAPANGAGFGYGWTADDEDESSYGISGVMISNYNPAAVANSVDGSSGNAWMNADEKTAAMGGTVVYEDYRGDSETMTLVIPLKSS